MTTNASLQNSFADFFSLRFFASAGKIVHHLQFCPLGRTLCVAHEGGLVLVYNFSDSAKTVEPQVIGMSAPSFMGKLFYLVGEFREGGPKGRDLRRSHRDVSRKRGCVVAFDRPAFFCFSLFCGFFGGFFGGW